MEASDRRRLIAEEESDEEAPHEEEVELTELHIPITTTSTAFDLGQEEDEGENESSYGIAGGASAGDDGSDDDAGASQRRGGGGGAYEYSPTTRLHHDQLEEDQQALLDYVAAISAAASADGSAAGGDPAGAGAGGVRGAAANALLDDPDTRRRLLIDVWKKVNAVLVLYLLPVTIGLLTVLTLDWGASCEKPLQMWAAVQTAIQLGLLGISVLVILQAPKPDASSEEIAFIYRKMYMYYLMNRTLDMAWASWFVIGMVWTFGVGAKECPESASYLYRGCLIVLIIQIVVLTVGVMLFCCICCTVSLRLALGPALAGMAPPPPPGASKKLINSLQLVKFSDDLGIDADHSNCAICLSDYERGQGIRFLPCKHHFHAECVDKWLLTNKSCPFCKQCIDKEPSPSSFTSSSSSSSSASSGPSIASSHPLSDIEMGEM